MSLYFSSIILFMNDEDRKYLRSEKKMRPGIKVFERMIQILADVQKKSDQLLNTINKSLLETFKSSKS